jgi:ribosome-associated translation inhibitor RaiA
MTRWRIAVIEVELHTRGDVPRAQVDAALRHIRALERFTDEPLRVRVTVTHLGRPDTKGAYTVDVSAPFEGRVLAAHTTGHGAAEAAEEAAKRLRRQLRDRVGAEVAQRNEPRDAGGEARP